MSDQQQNSLSELGKFWTFPNILSLTRLVLILPVTWLIMTDGRLLWIMILILLAIASDYFDGRVARWSHTESDWGKVLDPFADKIGGGMVVAALAFSGSLPLWFLAVLATRDLIILAGGAIVRAKTGRIVISIWAGKVAVTGVAVTALAALLNADAPVLEFCLWITTVLLAYSFVKYLFRFFMYLKEGQIPVDQDEVQEGDPDGEEVGSASV